MNLIIIILRIIAIFIWLLAGGLVLIENKITRLQYGLVWGTLIFELVWNLIFGG